MWRRYDAVPIKTFEPKFRSIEYFGLPPPTIYMFLPVAQQPDSGPWPPLTGLRDHTHRPTPHTVGLLCRTDQPDTETST